MKKLSKVALISVTTLLLVFLILGCGGATPLVLEVWEPEDGAVITSLPALIRGTTNAKAVTINGGKTNADSRGFFFAKINELNEGENTFVFVAEKGKETITQTVTITYAPEE